MNKVQRIHAADCETFQDFMFGTIFAVYAWNSAPVDGTNIVRSYAAIGREFPFPIDFERDPVVQREHDAQGQQTIEHVNNTFPLWRQQQTMLKRLVEERREHHRHLKNEGRHMKTFAPGDLVVIKKQVQTTQERGPAKARMNARGPYRILEQTKPGTYKLQKVPGVQGAGRRGKIMKESAARLTKIPSTLVIHKPAEGIDTRLATYRHAIVDNPLENILGLHEPGRYRQAQPAQPFAYDKIEDLWQEEVDNNVQPEDNDSSDDSESSDSYDEGDDRNNDDDGETSADNDSDSNDRETGNAGNEDNHRTRNDSNTGEADNEEDHHTHNDTEIRPNNTEVTPNTTTQTPSGQNERATTANTSQHRRKQW